MKSKLITASIAAVISVASLSAQTHYYPNAKSLQGYNVPEWYQDAKLGYWVHWGVYSVPAYAGDHAAEWYGRWMYLTESDKDNPKSVKGYNTAAHHRETYGDPKEFGYKDFIPMWKAEKFDASEWADIFTDGGAKFFTMMAMHHDNYPLWDSKMVPLNSVNTGPKRDFVAEMEREIRKRGLKFGVSNHSAWNSRFFEFHNNPKSNWNRDDSSPMYGNVDANSAENVDQWWARTAELVQKYKPDLCWFDWCWNSKPFNMQTRMNFTAWYYNEANDWGYSSKLSPEVVVAYKGDKNLPKGSAVLDLERGGMADVYPYVWMNDTSLGLHSWSYAEDEEYRSPNQVVDMLLDIISKNGILLLNIGPKADGTIPDIAQQSIHLTGEWLKVNGEGVYATRPWTIYGEGPTVPDDSMDGDHVEYTKDDIRFTRSKDNKTLYIHVLGYAKQVAIKSLKEGAIDLSGIESIQMFGSDKTIKYAQKRDAFEISMPKDASSKSPAFTFKVTFKGDIPELKVK